MNKYFTKSEYVAGMQCPRLLWLQRHNPDCAVGGISAGQIANGKAVGAFALRLFPVVTQVAYDAPERMAAETTRLLQSGATAVAEASFIADGLFCSVDILVSHGDNRVELYEVKSSTEVKPQYGDDIAFQYALLRRLGYRVEKATLLYVNSGYERRGDLDPSDYFYMEDLTATAADRFEDVCKSIDLLKAGAESPAEPDCPLQSQCIGSNGCPFFGHCSALLPKPNVFDLAGLQARTKLKYYAQGLITYPALLQKAKLTTGPELQIRHTLTALPDTVDRDKIAEFLNTLSFPLYFLDFESFQPPIPLYDRSHPYEQIAFQYSLHILSCPAGPLEHREYLAVPGEDPRRKLAEQLCRDIPMNVCTTAYNMAFEKTVIKKLAGLYPDLAEHLMNIHDGIRDLMDPFRQKHYYNRRMEGSYSIKHVLPALFPNDPALDYTRLRGVHKGDEASDTFMRMQEMSPEQSAISRADLLKYCELDTFAMVKLWQKLREVCG